MSLPSYGRLEDVQKRLSASMGQYRAEYIEQDIFKMFSPPTYWNQLVGNRPCILVGGRGTGKTTALRGLSHLGQFELCGPDISTWDTLGAYWRMESNVVTAFRGERLSEQEWTKLFSHYVNLEMLNLFLSFLLWRRETLGIEVRVNEAQLHLVCLSISVPRVDCISDLSKQVSTAIVEFELVVNSIGRTAPDLPLSVLGKPIELLMSTIEADPQFSEMPFTYCLDEYENLSNYQQKVFNTLIKHVGDSNYTFKVGMRRLGHRDRSTLVDDQPLADPADYTTIDIIDHLHAEKFSTFAANVCNNRLLRAFPEQGSCLDIERLLPSMSEEAEAKELGIDQRIREIRAELASEGASLHQLRYFDGLSCLSAYLVDFWAKSKGSRLLPMLQDAMADPGKWEVRRGNYAYSMLFTVRRKVRGFRKHYSGWNTFIQLADGNIRYLLQLVYEALITHTQKGKGLEIPVGFVEQTQAATQVGETQVNILQGLSAYGGQLTRLVLGMGRVFEVMANNPYGHAAEVNQFRIARYDSVDQADEVAGVVSAGIMHSALVPFIADKKSADSGETNAYDYFLHPIFAAYFGYSHRRKRRMQIAAADVLGLTSDQAPKAIERILRTQRRASDPNLPEQLSLYSEFYFEND